MLRRYMARNDHNDPVEKVGLFGVAFDITDLGAGDVLDGARRDAAIRHAEMNAFQKACAAAKDIDGARFFKEEARDAMKEYRAACLLLGQCEPERSGDAPYRDTREWPQELFGALDRIAGRLYLAQANLSAI